MFIIIIVILSSVLVTLTTTSKSFKISENEMYIRYLIVDSESEANDCLDIIYNNHPS